MQNSADGTLEEALPFGAYPNGGRLLLGRPKGDVARRGYGRDVLVWCGRRCAYCDLDMTTFEGWLQLSVDHVVPQQAISAGFPEDWILDTANLVACCRPCNDLFNRDPIVDLPPLNLGGFLDLRDRLFVKRRERIVERRSQERRWFEDHVASHRNELALSPLDKRSTSQRADVPQAIAHLAAHFRATGLVQAPIPWPRGRWVEAFPKHEQQLAALPTELDRAAVEEVGASATSDVGSAEFAFIVVMAWGFGNVGYGPFRTKRILTETPDAGRRLQSVAETLVRDKAVDGYRRLATDCRLRYLGPAFGTKFLYFTQPHDRRPRALILDALVAEWLRRNTRHDFKVVAWSENTYQGYIDLVHRWADALICEPDFLEYCMFQQVANERGRQWAGNHSD